MFDLNLTFFIFIGMFLLFIKLLSDLVLKPVGKAIEQRQAIIRDNTEAAQAARTQGAEVVSQYQARIHAVKAEAQSLISEVMTKAQQACGVEMKKVQDKGQAEIQAAREKLMAENKNLIDQLVDDEKTLVESITKKLIGESASVSLDSGTVRRALEEAR